jgi:hypothetical protein
MRVPLEQLSIQFDSYLDGGWGNFVRRSSGDKGLPWADRANLTEADEDEEIGVSLRTPTAIRNLQRKLYVAAKAQPERRESAPEASAVCCDVKPVGEPDAFKAHVRFDERR